MTEDQIHDAARKAGAFQLIAFAHLTEPTPERLEQARRELREALERLIDE